MTAPERPDPTAWDVAAGWPAVDAASTAFLVASPAAHGVLWVARVGETLPVAVALPEGTGWTIVGVAVSVVLMVLVARLGRDTGGAAR